MGASSRAFIGLDEVTELAKQTDLPDLSNYVTQDQFGSQLKIERGNKVLTSNTTTITLANAFDFICIMGRAYRPENGRYFIYSNDVVLTSFDVGKSTTYWTQPSGAGSFISKINSIGDKTISLTISYVSDNTNYLAWASFYS